MMGFHQAAGIIGGIVSLCGYIPYNYAALKGFIVPNKVTWSVWTMIGGLTLISYSASGVTIAVLWLPACYFLGRFITAIIAVTRGERSFGVVDRVAVVGAVIGVAVWLTSHSVFVVFIISIVIDFFGALPTIIKSVKRPSSENIHGWLLVVVGSVISLFAIESWSSVITITYPLYVLIVNCAILFPILLKKYKELVYE